MLYWSTYQKLYILMVSFPWKGTIMLDLHLSVCVIQVLCIGPTGTGKTLTMSDKLLNTMPAEYITHFLMFSARTSANQTQDYIDNKLDKRYACFNLHWPSMYLWVTISMVHLLVHQEERCVWASNRKVFYLLHWWPKHAHVGNLWCPASYWTAATVDGPWGVVWQETDWWEC